MSDMADDLFKLITPPSDDMTFYSRAGYVSYLEGRLAEIHLQRELLMKAISRERGVLLEQWDAMKDQERKLEKLEDTQKVSVGDGDRYKVWDADKGEYVWQDELKGDPKK